MKIDIKQIFSIVAIISVVAAIIKLLGKEEKVVYKRTSEDRIDVLIDTLGEYLNERQIEILKRFKQTDILYPSDIYELLPDVSTRTIRRDMTSLSELGLVIQEGSTRDTYYLLSKNIYGV